VTGAGGAPSFGVTGVSIADTAPPKYAVVSVAWAPSCGRSYHLIATGSRDGHVRIWRVKLAGEGNEEGEVSEADGQWEASIVADFNDHR
jgi:nucleoporin SEH1